MKIRSLLLTALLACTLSLQAQQSIPNGNFENWNHSEYDQPKYYMGSNREAYADGFSFNCIKSTDAYHGSSSVQLTTVVNATDTTLGYIINSEPDGDPENWHGGVPLNGKPTGIRAYFKSNIATGDTGLILVTFSKDGANIGTYMLPIVGVHATYSLLDYTFNPALSLTPDSVIFAATSSLPFGETYIPGSTLTIDSVSLTGIATQPAMLNGDFEQWEIIPIDIPSNWYTSDSGSDLLKSTDAHSGMYAVKMQTAMGDNDGVPVARGAMISTGYFDRNCSSNCLLKGGYPYTNTIDTLFFWYKYTSVGNSKASAYVTLKKNQMIVGGTSITLDGAASYQLGMLPFFSMQTPDTLVVQFQSNRWEDSLLTQVGSVLIIDGVVLKSQPTTGLSKAKIQEEHITVYPNPATNNLYITIGTGVIPENCYLTIYNILGQQLHTVKLLNTSTPIQMEMFANGTYLYTIRNNNTIVKQGRVVLQK